MNIVFYIWIDLGAYVYFEIYEYIFFILLESYLIWLFFKIAWVFFFKVGHSVTLNAFMLLCSFITSYDKATSSQVRTLPNN